MRITQHDTIRETFSCTALEIAGRPQIPDGKILCMTVNGVLQDAAPGTYTGDITVYLLDAMTEDLAGGPAPAPSGAPAGMAPPPQGPVYVSYRSALVTGADGIAAGASAPAAFTGTRLDADTVQGGLLQIRGSRTNVLLDETGAPQRPAQKYDADGKRIWQWIHDPDVGVYNGITITGGQKRISGLEIDLQGNGGDDFHLFGAAVAAAADAKVILEDCNIHTSGVIATAVTAAGSAEVLVRDSRLSSRGTDNTSWYKYNEKGMTSAAWVLAGRGTVRTTNALGGSTMIFYNTCAESNGWGVYSADEAAGIHHYMVNSDAKIPSAGEPGFEPGDFGAGYAVYALADSSTRILGCRFDIPDYAVIIAGGTTTHYVGSSSQENLHTLLGTDNLLYAETHGYADIPEQNTVVDSDHYGFLWHSNCTGKLRILPGTQLHVGNTVFLVKGSEILRNSPEVFVEDTQIDTGGRPDRLTIVHLMESDDAGQTDAISLHHDYKWAICHMSPDRREKLDGPPDAVSTFHFRNETLDGDFYNSVVTAVQLLQLDFDGCRIQGEISSGDSEHVNKSFWYAEKDGQKLCIDGQGRAYRTIREAPWTARSMGSNVSVTRIYVHPEAAPDGSFVYDDSDPAVYQPTGYAIYYTDAQEISHVRVTPSAPLNNPVSVTLRNGSVWTVQGQCHLTALTIDETSRLEGRLLCGGVPAAPGPGSWSGDLLVLPEEG